MPTIYSRYVLSRSSGEGECTPILRIKSTCVDEESDTVIAPLRQCIVWGLNVFNISRFTCAYKKCM